MYKELKDAIRKFTPGELERESIVNNFLSHSFKHTGNNLIGEMYEAWVYEYLKLWADRCEDVKRFVLKEPSSNIGLRDGLLCDNSRQIIYQKNGKKIAEFDGLFNYKGKVVFVESSVSDLRSYYKKLEDRIVKKRELLTKLFNTQEIYYLVVTRPKKRSLTYRSLPHLVLWTLKNPNYFELTKTDRVVSMLNSSKFIKLDPTSSFFS